MNVSKEIAKLLLDLKCVQLCPEKPFTYASGLKGPIYCDNRKLLSHVEARNLVKKSFVQLIKDNSLQFDLIAGMATAGIAHAALVADELAEPMVYVRSKAKGHGKQNQVEGDFIKGQKLLLIEDLVNQGKSLGEGIDGVRNAELVVKDCLSIVTYEMLTAKELLDDKGVSLYTLTTFSDLIEVGAELGQLNSHSIELLVNWQKNPANWP